MLSLIQWSLNWSNRFFSIFGAGLSRSRFWSNIYNSMLNAHWIFQGPVPVPLWLDCNFVVNEIEHQTCNYIHFRNNAPAEGKNPLFHQAIRLIVPVFSFFMVGFGIKWPNRFDMPFKTKNSKKEIICSIFAWNSHFHYFGLLFSWNSIYGFVLSIQN